MLSTLNCNSVPDFSRVANTGNNLTILITNGFYDKVSKEIGFNYTSSSYFAVNDATGEIVGYTLGGEGEYDDYQTSFAVWGKDSTETVTDSSTYIGIEDEQTFSIYILDGLDIWEVMAEGVYVINGSVVVNEDINIEFKCTIQQSEGSFNYLYEQLTALEDELESVTITKDWAMGEYISAYLASDTTQLEKEVKKWKGKYNEIYQEWFDALNEISHVSRETHSEEIALKVKEISDLTEQLRVAKLSLGNVEHNYSELLAVQTEVDDTTAALSVLHDEVAVLTQQLVNANSTSEGYLSQLSMAVTAAHEATSNDLEQVAEIELLKAKILSLKAEMENTPIQVTKGFDYKKIIYPLAAVTLLFLTLGRK